MKLIGILQAVSGVRAKEEEVSSLSSAPVRNIIDGLRARYKFAVNPALGYQQDTPSNMLPQIVLRGGAFESGDEKLSVGQIAITADSILVASDNSERADKIVDDVAAYLSEEFGFRFRGKHMIRRYLTNAVVEFEGGFLESLDVIEKMATLLENLLPKFPGSQQVAFKRLGFGRIPEDLVDWDHIERGSFTIERRVNEPFSSNRYFCTGPISSSNLIMALENMEKLVSH